MARVQGGSQAVLAGAVQVVIAGAFTAPYEPGVTPAWATTTFVAPASKTAAQFTVQFGTAPVADTTVDWGVLDSGT